LTLRFHTGIGNPAQDSLSINVHRILGIACVSLLAGLILGSCAADAAPSLNEVKKFDAYRLYYASAEVAGLQLEEILGDPSQNNQRSAFNFIYGTCELEGEDHPSCAPPIEIQVFSTCRRWFSAISGKRRIYAFRGAKATGGKGGVEGGSPIEVFTGRTTVVIWAEDRNILKAAAHQLRDVRAAGPQLHLPPPVPGSLSGKLPCQRKPG
jgi:hypothetical protein